MPRPKMQSDSAVLEIALAIIHEQGPDALTFASLSEACGLSPATLVQRFSSKVALKQAALLHAWDRLDERTAVLAADMPKTPQGAVQLLVALSGDYGGIDSYAEGLLVLREDFRDPVLRARGAKWKAELTNVLEKCFTDTPSAPAGIGLLIAAQWQGSLLWWAFDPQGPVDAYVTDHLRMFVASILASANADDQGDENVVA